MITHELDLDMVPGGHKLEFWLNQYDSDFTLKFNLYAHTGDFSVPAGTTADIRGTKPDGNGYSATADVLGKTITINGDVQITAAAGKCVYELTLYNDDKKLSTANFIIHVEQAALDKDSIASDSKIKEFSDVIDKTDEIIAAGRQYAESQEAMRVYAEQAAASATAAETAKTEVQSMNSQFASNVSAANTAIDTKRSEALEEIDAKISEADQLVNTDFEEKYNAATAAIDEKAEDIVALTTSADLLARRALEQAANAENEAAETSNDVNALSRNQETILSLIEDKFDDAYDDGTYIYMLKGGNIVRKLGPFAGGSGGGGGGGGSDTTNAVFSGKSVTGWVSNTIAKGGSCPVSIQWSSTENDIPTGNGTLTITMGNTIRAALEVEQGIASVDLSPYLSDGVNSVEVRVSDLYDNFFRCKFTINVVNVSLSSTFDPSTPFQGSISFPYTPVGTVEKTVYFLLDGQQIGSNTTSVSGRAMSFTIPQQSHGAHTLEVYFDCTINYQLVTSNRLYYEIICTEPLNNTPIIVSPFNAASAAQYSTLLIPYTVYDPKVLTADVTISVNGETVSEQTVDRTQQTFSYRALDTGTLRIAIASGTTTKTIVLDITETDIDVEAETNLLSMYLSSAGRSNNEAEPDTWVYGAYSMAMTGFNHASDGWQLDEDGITARRFASSARGTLNYQPFASDFRTTGKTIELEFATSNVLNYDTPVISCMSGDRGFYVTPQLATLVSEQSEISMQFKENEHVRITFVVTNRANNRLILMYVNGIMSGAVQYPASDDFQQTSPVGISFGCSDCTLDLYCLRVYDVALSRTQVLNNWIADTQDVTQMLERYQRNNVYDAYGNIVISKLPTALPYMIISCEELPQYKGDKKTTSISYTDPVTPAKSFTATNAEANVQGTSSQYYRRKNYKVKFKNGFVMQNGAAVSRYDLRDGAIATNAFCFKADVASSEGANNVELARLYNDTCPYKTPAQKADSAIRQGIDGFPMVIFWNNGEETSFLGKYNFNNDKGTEEVFGFTSGDESWEVKNNTSDRVLFMSDDFTAMVLDEDGNMVPAWTNDFEPRFPDTDPMYDDIAQLAEFVSWVKSTDRNAATGDDLASPVTYGGVSYSKDTAAYRLAKFAAEMQQYMEKDSALFYYLFTELFLMVDSRAKNAFPSFIGSEVA